ncbi:50S ribosomal protein L9 [Zostera marina]|uniref:Large ribosomal subunit protein bL9c n=1 Tax=Zostera marina TaxID=29655 RepID=A0A0K9PI11_ZOSMR|nr:50S ribosomal protein L9 [Zostera marina]
MLQRSRGVLMNLDKIRANFTNPVFFGGQTLRYKKTLTKVILTTNVDRLGQAGDTVAVAPGYFRNYLMPNLLAVPNLQKYNALVKEQIKLRSPEKEEVVVEDQSTMEWKMKDYIKAANILADVQLTLRRFISTEKELRKPVTKEELVEEVARQLNVAIQPENIQLHSPLAYLGEHEVPLRLPRQIPLPEGIHSWVLHVKIRKK